jgi:tRNA(Ile)-lysidine synthase
VTAQPPKLENSASVAVAVSGGSDSLSVLYSLVHARGSNGPANLRAVTVDHGLRDGSAAEAAHVAALCAEWNVPHTTLTWDDWDGRGNLQDQARRARYRLIADWAKAEGVDAVVLAHTADDLAETFLMQVGRKAGLNGLTSMAKAFEQDGIWFHRPFLGARRAELRQVLEDAKVTWIEDPSNEDAQFQRVKVRNAMSALEDAGIDVAAFAAVVDNLRVTRGSVGSIFAMMVRQLVREDAGDLVLSVGDFLGWPPDFRRLFLTLGIQWVSGRHYPPRASSFRLPEFKGADLVPFTVGGCLIQNYPPIDLNSPSQGGGPRDVFVRISREFNAVKDFETTVDKLWDGRWRLSGPASDQMRVRALGESGLQNCPEWRATGQTRETLHVTPAVWMGETLIAAPVAGLANGWTAQATGRGNFNEFLLRR